MVQVPPEPVDSPSGNSYVVRAYRSGTMGRFPSARNTYGQGQGLRFLLDLVGWLIHVIGFRGQWTVAVTPWHNLPGAKYRERAVSEAEATDRSTLLAAAIRHGQWIPGEDSPPAR
jgi:hypothetical protein